MPKTSIKATRRFWDEGKENAQCKNIFRELARKHGCGCVEEEEFTVDLHDTNELQPKGTLRRYPVDIFITRKNPPVAVICEIDGMYHRDNKQAEKDEIRDRAITARYGIRIYRFDKKALLNGFPDEERLVGLLGL